MTPLYLQEKTRMIGMHPNRRLFARSIATYASAINAPGHVGPFRNMGVWEFVGMTGDWARVLGLYEYVEGWTSFCDMISQTMKAPSAELAATYRAVEERRTGGFDEILAPLEGSPTYQDLKTNGAKGALLVIDEAQVEPGTEDRYGAAVMKEWMPIAKGYRHDLIGHYQGALTDGMVVTYWATGLDDYAALMASADAKQWRRSAVKLRRSWRQELWTAAPGSRFSDSSFDYGDRDIRQG